LRFSKEIFSILVLLSVAYVFPQETTHGGFAAPVIKISTLDSKTAILGGVRAGWVIDERVVLGAAYYGILNSVDGPYIDPVTKEQYNIELTMGGLDLEYIFMPHHDLNFSIEMFCGGGGIKYISTVKANQYNTVGGNDLLVWEPQLNFNYKINDWLRLSSALGYRFVSQYSDYLSLRKKDVEGLSFNVALRFGAYR